MRYMLAVAVAAMCLGLFGTSTVRADEMKVKGVLIDQMCAAKMMDKDDPQAAAEEHKKDCCLKCAKDGMAIISGKKMYKLDDASAKKAMKYLEKHDNMNVMVDGDEKDGTLALKGAIKEDKEKAPKKDN